MDGHGDHDLQHVCFLLVRLPERSELNPEINEQLIVEYYNRLYKPIAHDDSTTGESKKEMNISETPTFDAWTYSNIK